MLGGINYIYSVGWKYLNNIETVGDLNMYDTISPSSGPAISPSVQSYVNLLSA